MYDKGKIITVLLIGILFILLPFWFNIGKTHKLPEPELTEKAKLAKKCILPKKEIRSMHQALLVEWRDSAVREGQRLYYSKYNDKSIEISLENTCMDCHSNKKDFGDECHNYAGVTGGSSPTCWNCHNEPKE
jgi:cytochrome c peroxidase